MIALDEAAVKALLAACDDGALCDDGDGVRLDYSGRCMYGDTCIGYVGNDPTQFALELAAVVAASAGDEYDDSEISLEDLRDAQSCMGAMRYDNMGLSMIWYWPGVHVCVQALHLADDR